MSYGPLTYFILTMASAGTSTSAMDLGRGWKQIYIDIQSMVSNSQIHIKGCPTASGTFRRVYHPSIASTTIETDVFAIHSSVSNGLVPIPNGVRFVKIETTATVDSGCQFNLICSD